MGQNATDKSHVQVSGSVKEAVKPPEKGPQEKDSVVRRRMAGLHRFEEGRAEHRGQDQGNQDRKQHGCGDGHGKLPIDNPGGAGEKGHGAEYRREHQADADQGAGNLVHGLGRGLPGRETFLSHDSLHILHHHDRIVHQETDGQDHGEHGQHVDGEAEKTQDRKGPQQHHRYCDGRDQCGPEGPHKKIHDHEDEQDRLEKGLDHLFDCHFGKRGGVIGINHLHARGKIPAHLPHLFLDSIGRIQCIGACGLADGQACSGLAVVNGFDIVALGPQFRASHIFDSHDGAVRIGADGDGSKLIRGLEQMLDNDGGVQSLALHRRPAP